jgi:uncharacterized protein with von Willebrand factor type A (vWA) domain
MAGQLFANLLLFTRGLRSAGVDVRPGAIPDAVRALEEVGIARKQDVRDALRTVLISRYDDLARFEAAFERFWRPRPASDASGLPEPMRAPRRVRSTVRSLGPGSTPGPPGEPEGAEAGGDVTVRTYSAGEAWHTKDFAQFTPEDVARASAVLAQLTWTAGLRVTRRWVSGAGRAPDLRRLLRVNAKHGGELFTIPRRARRVARRPLVVVCDVSGSMEPYTRMLLLFAHAIARRHRSVEVFLFSTRLTRVTRYFADRRANEAIRHVQAAVRDWSGGTRIGDAIRAVNVDWARRVLRRGPIVLLISDGWDLGEPELLRREIARLQRSAFRLIWLNPLIGSPGYEPLTRGMRAALPFVDDFLPVHNMASLEVLAAELDSLPDRRAARRTFTPWN